MFPAGSTDFKSTQGNVAEEERSAVAAIGSIVDQHIVADNVDIDVDIDVENVPTQKPHFLDYDAVPPPDLEENFSKLSLKTTKFGQQQQSNRNETEKKNSIQDIEISDYEFIANGYTKKEFTQDDNTLHLANSRSERPSLRKNAFNKPKHFLDENPIPPDYMLEKELREHHSLDRNFKRQSDDLPRSQHSSSSRGDSLHRDHRDSFERGENVMNSSITTSETRLSRERLKAQIQMPSYSLSRFLQSPQQAFPPQRAGIAKGAAWMTTEQLNNSYDGLDGLNMAASSTDLEMDALGPKVECVYSLLSMLGSNDPLKMAKKFLELSRTPETCATLRRSGCIPLLVQMMHSAEAEENVRKCASMALYNVIHSNPDEKSGRRESKVLRLLDQITDYCSFLKSLLQSGGEAIADDTDRHPLAAMSSLMKVSFDEEHRHAMCEFGALQIISNLVHLDHAAHGPRFESDTPENDANCLDAAIKPGMSSGQACNSLRRYALMALTNLTFGDENNKAILCSQKSFMEALVAQLDSAPDDLLQVTASVLRNLSWRADNNMKAVLNEIGTVTALARAAMKNKNENTLKAILSALWNLSAHCSTNKAEFCAVEGALGFLVDMLTYEGPSKTLKIIENAGGILRNVSSHIAVRENYRQILRERNCLAILLQQLKSESLTVVSNSCGTLWNLSARCPEDQKFLWDNGAVPMLRSLIHSKHAMISEGSSSALKNLLNFRPSGNSHTQLDPIARSMGLKKLPTLNVRKQRALEQELDAKGLTETCENLDTNIGVDRKVSNEKVDSRGDNLFALKQPPATARLTRSAMISKSESRDSIFSAKSDSAYEHLARSHSASDANRHKVQASKLLPYNAQISVYGLKNADNDDDDTHDELEQPINYSIKYNETSATKSLSINKAESNTESPIATTSVYTTYQETDLDQPTDFSLRYAENQIESDVDATVADEVREHKKTDNSKISTVASNNTVLPAVAADSNEILLILEDSVKCYRTEDTPYVISNAASITDLRQNHKTERSESVADNPQETLSTTVLLNNKEEPKIEPTESISHNEASINKNQVPSSTSNYISGSYTPEKPINYCEEGTPGYFSRYDSLSSLEESPGNNDGSVKANKPANIRKSEPTKATSTATEARPKDNSKLLIQANTATRNMATSTSTATQNINSAQETPLMFSRHSSMDSLIVDEDDIVQCDDKSSVVSDFSRLASGIISPSEIPDSPTQSMPQSPRRDSDSYDRHNQVVAPTGESISPVASRRNELNMRNAGSELDHRPLRSVFEDDLNTFHVENTPAQFSCATSLSNLSIIDDLTSSPEGARVSNNDKQQKLKELDSSNVADETNENLLSNIISEGEEEESVINNDDILLANCINIGMNRSSASGGAGGGTRNISKEEREGQSNVRSSTCQMPFGESITKYCTEDTPALLSKVGSNSNLSAISICSSNNNAYKDEQCLEGNVKMPQRQRDSQISEEGDMSSNASESGVTHNKSFDILQECIRDGMKKKQLNTNVANATSENVVKTFTGIVDRGPVVSNDPISMMRRGGTALPRYLPVADETNKYLIEDSPCNFSIKSGLSNLTVGSSLVGPAVRLKESESSKKEESVSNIEAFPNSRDQQVPRHEDSLSSLSAESEDDTNLLSQAIAAGCNRPKSNLGFSSKTSTSSAKRSHSLSASQPIPIGFDNASSQLFRRNHGDQAQTQSGGNINGNESFSSVDSSDSNDNQSKSLLELCILTGMHKAQDKAHSTRVSRHHHHHHHGRVGFNSTGNVSTQSNPNLKQFDSLPLQMSNHSSSSSSRQKQSSGFSTNRHLRDRERKDEKLLQECINTGISKKIANSNKSQHSSAFVNNLNVENRLHGMVGSECVLENFVQPRNVPKNVQATSAAALNVEVEVEMQCSANLTNTAVAASGVEKNHHEQSQRTDTTSKVNNSNNNLCTQQLQQTNYNGTPAAITDEVVKQTMMAREDAVLDVEKPQNLESDCVNMNATGFKAEDTNGAIELNKKGSLENSNSDDSNESFIIETTVSLLEQQAQRQEISVSTVSEKHKDPDLMLKSVERLTLEFVTSAEQLRTCGTSENSRRDKRHDSFSLGGGNSNNTWNEDTHPNDVSFPSVSISVPMVDSLTTSNDNNIGGDDVDDDLDTVADHNELNDFAEITPTNEEQTQQSILNLVSENELAFASLTPNTMDSLDADTVLFISEESPTPPSNFKSNPSSSSINFKLGGAVQTAATTTAGHLNSCYNHGPISMTSSAIIANEARALAENLLQQNNFDDSEDLTFSINSLDLDNIRPPSGMESLNISGYYQEQQMTAATQPNSLQKMASLSPQICGKSPKFPRKALPAGLVARRALGQFTGSAESVNSSFNLLDNIKPPSLMDELLDSMISVSSIQSEIADCCESMATTLSLSNYETANGNNSGGEIDDNTITLHSCCDALPCDDDDEDDEATANNCENTSPLRTSNENCSSAESTPQLSLNSPDRRSLTPKMKRKLSKDRFKTYTISSGSTLSPLPNAVEPDEILQIEVFEQGNGGSASRRRSSQDRYKTQTIVYPVPPVNDVLNITEEAPQSLTSTDDCLSDDMSSIIAMTKQFKHITEAYESRINSTEPLELFADNYNSLELEQNSETESCNGKRSSYTRDFSEEEENVTNLTMEAARNGPLIKKPPIGKEVVKATSEEQQVKAIRGRKKPAYVSPYSMQYHRSNTAPVTRIAKKLPPNISGVSKLRKQPINNSTSCINTKTFLKKKNSLNELEVTPPKASLERQGTFVKDQPTITNGNVPIVETIYNTITISPKRSSKLPMKRTSQTNPTSPKIGVARVAAVNRKIPSPKKPQRSVSNTSMKTTNTTTAARVAVLANRVSTTTPPSRSNSNLNDGNLTNRISQAQSRIAGIWKRVNDVKTKQQQQQVKATTSNLKANYTKSSSALNADKKQKEQQLIRSSTFDNSPPNTIETKGKKSITTVECKNITASSIRPVKGVLAPVTKKNFQITATNRTGRIAKK